MSTGHATTASRTSSNTSEFTIVPRGPFELRELAVFGFGQRLAPTYDGIMRLAFCVDGYETQVGVEVRQDDAGVHAVVHSTADQSIDVDAVRQQVARVLSLDHDGDAYVAVGDRDPVVRRLLEVAPGLRPPLFYSPYEAAAWSVLSARRPAQQMAEVRRRLSASHGASFELTGESHAAFPTPEQLVRVSAVPALTTEKMTRLHAVARAAMHGRLDAHRLARMDPADAMVDLQSLPGIGPFYSALVVVRGTGCTDVLATDEPRLREIVGALYGLPGPASAAELTDIAEAWRPFRTWVSVLARAAGARLLGAGEPTG